MKPPYYIQFAEHRTSIELIQDIIYCGYWVALSYYGLVSSSYVYTKPGVSRGLRDYYGKVYPREWPLDWLLVCAQLSLSIQMVWVSTFGQQAELIH